MPFPISLSPTSRTFEAGDYPIKRFTSQSGVETRILYGSRRTGQKMSLTYQNIFDYEAEQFVDHYDEVFGTLNPFSIASAGQTNGGKAGWNGFNVPGPFSSGGYSVSVTPASLVEGDRFRIDYTGPANATLYVKVSGNDINTADFSSLFGSTPPSSLEGTANTNAQGTSFVSGNQVATDLDTGFEVMVVEVFTNTARLPSQLVASVSVPIVDTTSSTGTSQQPAAKASTIGAGAYSSGWRYEGPPQLTQVRPGISTVTVNLVAVL